ncbi:MAG: hypothetical protein ACE5JT_04285 [Nitrosopumilaceae archaeon]
MKLMASTSSYFREVNKAHRKYAAAIKNAKSRQTVLNAYWRHKREHENILRRHLREEMNEVNRIKRKIPYR